MKMSETQSFVYAVGMGLYAFLIAFVTLGIVRILFDLPPVWMEHWPIVVSGYYAGKFMERYST